MANAVIRKFLSEIGRKGGQATTPAKRAASRRNAKKALAARLRKRARS